MLPHLLQHQFTSSLQITQSKGLGAAANPLGALFGALGDKDDSSQGKTETPNVKVDVNVKIGEKQLTDIIIEALASPEAGKAISPFLN